MKGYSNGADLFYSLKKRLSWAAFALLIGVLIAGFWNYKVVDGFGREFITAELIGNSTELAQHFSIKGLTKYKYRGVF
jgi:hypothetical protein